MFIILLLLISARPFISSLTFSYANLIYSATLAVFLLIWILRKKTSFTKSKLVHYPLILFMSAFLVSYLCSSGKIQGLSELFQDICGITLFFICASLAKEDKEKVFQLLLFSGFFISLLAIYQYFFGFSHLHAYVIKEKISGQFVLDYIKQRRVFFPFVTPNTLSGYLAMIIPLSLAQKNRIWLIPFFSLALLFTRSLGALTCIFVGIIIFFCLRPKFKLTMLSIFFVFLIVVGVFYSRNTAVQLHLKPCFSAVARLRYWQDTLKIISSSPILGVGPGNFNLTYSRYTHNSYLQIWAETGIFSLFSFLWFVFIILKLTLKNIKDNPHNTQIICLFTANIIFLLHNLVDFTFFLPEVSLIWWVIAGLSLSFPI